MKINERLGSQIRAWQMYSVFAPAVFIAVATALYWIYGTPFAPMFYVATTLFAITCVAWWHWSLATMMTMLSIMRETDDHFETVANELAALKILIKENAKGGQIH